MEVSPATGQIALQRMLSFANSAASPLVACNHSISTNLIMSGKKCHGETYCTCCAFAGSIPDEIWTRSQSAYTRYVDKNTALALLLQKWTNDLSTLIETFDVHTANTVELLF
jgi:hypothetical protein